VVLLKGKAACLSLGLSENPKVHIYIFANSNLQNQIYSENRELCKHSDIPFLWLLRFINFCSAGAKVLLETNLLELLSYMPMHYEICGSYKNNIFKISVVEILAKIILGKIYLKIELKDTTL